MQHNKAYTLKPISVININKVNEVSSEQINDDAYYYYDDDNDKGRWILTMRSHSSVSSLYLSVGYIQHVVRCPDH